MKQTPNKKVVSSVPRNQAPSNPVVQKAPEIVTGDIGKKSIVGSGDATNKVSTSSKMSSPVKQREYRRPDGRKRIIPEALGVPVHRENLSDRPDLPASDFPLISSDSKRADSRLDLSDNGSGRRTFGGNFDPKETAVGTARTSISDCLVIEKVANTTGKEGGPNVEQAGVVKNAGCLSACSSSLSIRVIDKKEGSDAVPISLEARPREQAASDLIGIGNALLMKETEVVCKQGTETLWSDRISGKVTVLAGNANFWAVGCEEGCLQVNFFK